MVGDRMVGVEMVWDGTVGVGGAGGGRGLVESN